MTADSADSRLKPEVAPTAGETIGQVLLVDDDRALLNALERALHLRHYDVLVAADASEALSTIERGEPDVIVLDIMMPGLNGLVLCRLLRERTAVPILMLTARDSVPDRVAGLRAGADDYLTKPFALEELAARIEALLRRVAKGARRETLAYLDIILDPITWSAARDDQELGLTPTEFRLLECLMRTPEQVVTREQILRDVWGNDWSAGESNIVEVHIANLRHKLESEERSRLVQTVRGVGYMLRASADSPRDG